MWRWLLVIPFVITGQIFPDNEWDEEDVESDEEFFSDRSRVTYGGMSIDCDYGCGNPDYDGNAYDIQYLFCKWLPRPLYGSNLSFFEDKYYSERFNLSDWEGEKLYDTNLQGYFYHAEFDQTHDEFLKDSSQFLKDLDKGYFVCQADINRHQRNIKKIKELQSQGACCVKFNGDEIEGYDSGLILFNLIPIETAIELERKAAAGSQIDFEKYDRYREYAEDVFRRIDSMYKEIFAWCLENHQPEGIAFYAALDDLLANDLDSALDQIRYLINLAEAKNWDKELIAKLSFVQGQVENELCLYSDAILDLTRSIQKDPHNREAYLERARAYFEVGEFDRSIHDFVASGIRNNPVDPTDTDLFGFASGIMTGVSRGALEGVSDFIPSMLNSLKSLGSGIWSFVQEPVGISEEFARSASELVKSIRSVQDISCILIPELKDLITQWDQFSSFQRGECAGHIIGKYGIDILLGFGAGKGLQAYIELRRASAIHTFENCLRSETNAAQITKAAQKAQLAREGDFIDKSFRLKNGKLAVIKKEKITSYALTDSGKSKGFRDILGYNESNWQDLKVKIEQGVLQNKAKFHKIDQHGAKFTVDMSIQGPKGKAIVRTGWIYENNESAPRLTTLFVYKD